MKKQEERMERLGTYSPVILSEARQWVGKAYGREFPEMVQDIFQETAAIFLETPSINTQKIGAAYVRRIVRTAIRNLTQNYRELNMYPVDVNAPVSRSALETRQTPHEDSYAALRALFEALSGILTLREPLTFWELEEIVGVKPGAPLSLLSKNRKHTILRNMREHSSTIMPLLKS